MSSLESKKRNARSITIIALLVLTVLFALLTGYAIANVVFQQTTIPLQIEDPIQILHYPTSLNLYPGQTVQINVTLENNAPVTYSVSLDYQLNDSVYQANYAVFSNTVYNVSTGEQTLNGFLSVSSKAPAANLTLTITCNRTPQSSPTASLAPTNQPTQPSNLTTDNSTLPPSLQLLQGGAAWATPNGGNVLYLDWKSCWLSHSQTDGVNWGPWWSVDAMDMWRSEVTQALNNDGFNNMTYAGTMPQNLTGYNLLVIEAFYAVEPKDAVVVKDFVANGGGVVMIGGSPCYLSAYCKDFWPGAAGGANLTSIADWFGYSDYMNYFGDAYTTTANPLGTSLANGTELFWCSSASASPASVSGPQNSTQVIVSYVPDTTFGFGVGSSFGMPPFPIASFGYGIGDNPPFAFTHEYGAGRVYWQGHIWPF